MNTRSAGFIQIPIIIAFMLGVAVLSSVSYLLNHNPQTKTIEQAKGEENTEFSSNNKKESEVIKTDGSIIPVSASVSNSSGEPASTIPKKQEASSNLKIAKCQAVRETTYAMVISKINELFNKTEKDEFNRIQQEMYKQFDQVYAVSAKNKSAITNSGLNLTPDAATSAMSDDTTNTEIMLDRIQVSSQVAWNNRKNELEVAHQTSINKANEQLNKDYLNCLNQ